MKRFNENQRVVLAVDPADLVHVNCSGAPLNTGTLYHIHNYGKPFNGLPMVRLKGSNTLYLESLFKPANRKRISRFVGGRING